MTTRAAGKCCKWRRHRISGRQSFHCDAGKVKYRGTSQWKPQVKTLVSATVSRSPWGSGYGFVIWSGPGGHRNDIASGENYKTLAKARAAACKAIEKIKKRGVVI